MLRIYYLQIEKKVNFLTYQNPKHISLIKMDGT